MILLPIAELEVVTPDDQVWPIQWLHVVYLKDGPKAFVQPVPPAGSRVMHTYRKVVEGMVLETSVPLCEV